MDSSKAPKEDLNRSIAKNRDCSCNTEKRKSAGVDNTPAFVQNIQVGRNTTTDVLTEIFPQQGNLQLYVLVELRALRCGRAVRTSTELSASILSSVN